MVIRTEPCFNLMRKRSNISLLITLLIPWAAVLARATSAPDWLKAAAGAAVTQSYGPRTAAVVLLDEQRLAVNSQGDVKALYRTAYRILNSDGRGYGTLKLAFNSFRKIKRVQGWTIPGSGGVYERGNGESVDVATGGESLYSDQGTRVLELPAADPGNIVGFEYEVEEKPEQLQFFWIFQDTVPVMRAYFELALPSGWEIKSYWRNQKAVEPQVSGNTYSWELSNIPAIEIVERMPHWRSISGHMAVSVTPSINVSVKVAHSSSWGEISSWYGGVVGERQKPSEKVIALTQQLTANTADWLGKVEALAAYVQSKIRYVAIEIGKGGYQPHFPDEVLSSNYGDCKDKATLLSTMLQATGIRSYVVLANTDRDAVTDDFPSRDTFNHAILAIVEPADKEFGSDYAVVPVNGERLLFFGPTDTHTPLGQLPDYLQGNRVLVAASGISGLTHFPLPKPAANSLVRKAKIQVGADGTISGDVEERRSGSMARQLRYVMLSENTNQQKRYMESFLTLFMNQPTVQDYNLQNLHDDNSDLILSYKFEAPSYVRQMAGLTVMRVRIVGQKTDIAFETDRKYPLEIDVPSLQTDQFEITLPADMSVDELPDSTDVRNDYAEYVSRIEIHDNLIRYSRTYQVKNGLVPVDQLKEMKSFYRAVAADERANVVLKTAPSGKK